MAHQPYHVDGKRVPSVTTITSRFADKGGLIFWANSVGLGERDCDEQTPCKKCGRRQGKNHRDASKKAADIGNYAHALIELEVNEAEIQWSDYEHLDAEQLKLAEDCMEAFHAWRVGSSVKITESEYPLVSATHMFGGCLDGIGYVNGKFCLLDWKTSRGIYEDYLAQLAGYLILLEENGLPDVEEIHILRVSKETAAFEHRMFPRRTFQPAIDYFLRARQLYEDSKALKKLLR